MLCRQGLASFLIYADVHNAFPRSCLAVIEVAEQFSCRSLRFLAHIDRTFISVA